jgi:diguanylate cyclase (GGDEF)-like protein/PAS domain S-box-containing protein
MSVVAAITTDAEVAAALRALAPLRGWDLLVAAPSDTWPSQQPGVRIDVFVVEAQQLSPQSLADARQLHAGCEFVALQGHTTEQATAQLINLQVYQSVAVKGASGAGATKAVAVSTESAPVDMPTALLAAVCCALEKAALRREHTELRRKLAAREEIFDLVGRATHDGLWEWDLSAEKIFFSPRWKQMLGFEATEVSTDTEEWFARVHPEEQDQLREEIKVHLERMTEYFQSQHRVRHKSGQYRWMISRGQALRDSTGKATKLVGSHTDITLQKVSEQRLLHEAFHDALTGLPNNALLRDRLQRAAAFARRRPDYTYAVLFLDVDRFKKINDSLGHLAGDQLLIGLAERLRSCVRPVDLVARLGSDEFTILLDDIGDRQEAARTAERVQRALALPFALGSQEIYASASIGIALSSDKLADPYDLVRDADTAMYRAKTRKNGVYEIFDSSMHTQAVHRLGMETSLRRALGKNELRLHYQPIMNLKTRKLVGFEALLRWFSAERGLVQPSDFIGLAEETGLIIPIGRWVLREACQQMMAWRSSLEGAADLFVSVNISPRQFTQADLVDQIAEVLRDTHFDPKLLKLEVTESLLIDNVGSTAVMMDKLRSMDVRLCIDDFGTGYSSLSTLYQLPIHTLKVDRSFVGRLGTHGSHGEIVDTIILLAHNLNMDVIAEGIETPLQLLNLQSRACDYGQGYLFSKPVPPESAAEMIKAAQLFEQPKKEK